MKKTLLLLFALAAMGLTNVWAYDFSAVAPGGQTLYYSIVDGKAQVTSQNSGSPYYSTYPTGALVIPSSVTYNGTTYSVTTIGDGAFNGCRGLTSVTIPNSVTTIENYAFWSCDGLTSVTIPNSVTSIGKQAFMYCHGLTSVTIGNSVTTIGESAFYNCSGLTSVTIPNSVTTIGKAAFSGCRSLASMTVKIGNAHYDSRNNCNAIIETSTSRLIAGCRNTVIPHSVTAIGNSAFSGCDGLTSVTIPNSVTTIGDGAFNGCRGLTSVTIPNSVTAIGEYAFQYCSGLTSVTIPHSVTTIGNSAFAYCRGLTSIYSLSVNPPTIEDNTFEDVNKNIPLYVPTESVYRYTNAFGWSDFTTIIGISTQGIEEAEQAMAISVQGSSITVANAQNQMLAIYDIAGRVIAREQAVEGRPYAMPRAGVYMVQVGSSPARKVVVMR